MIGRVYGNFAQANLITRNSVYISEYVPIHFIRARCELSNDLNSIQQIL